MRVRQSLRQLQANENAKRVLVYRIGSIGDTCVAIPALRLIRRCFANAEIRGLTNFPVNDGLKAAPLQSIIGRSGLVDGYFEYPLGLKNWDDFVTSSRVLKQWRPDVFVYLMPVRTRRQIIRDFAYFKGLLGFREVIGLTLDRSAQTHLWNEEKQLFEAEAHRLLRNLSALGTIDLQAGSAWDLGLQTEETECAANMLKNWPGRANFVVCSIGAKWDSKDWGQDRWEEWANKFSRDFPRYGLVLVGSGVEKERSESIASRWQGLALNLCGLTEPRESAWIISQAKCFIGHDSGPMHLAAAVGSPSVAIFSAQDKPGVWFPYGEQHRVIYHKTDCFGCQLEVCKWHEKKCMRTITVDEVLAAMKLAITENAR